MDNLKKLRSLWIWYELLNPYNTEDQRLDIQTKLNYREFLKVMNENFKDFTVIRGWKTKYSKMFLYVLEFKQVN